jgi:formamidopyrimidine-DNA glycosylase
VPELPEVEVVRRGLAQWVAGRTVAGVEVRHPRAIRRHLEGADSFVAALTGRTLGAAHRRGKYLWLPVAEPDGTPAGRALVAHLGMSGQLLVEKPSQPDEVHLRARFTFTDGGRELRFVDQRTFGGLAVEDADGEGVPPRLAHIAIDPLDPSFDADRFSAALRRRRTEVKRALLDQTLIGGVGNIYADESLWRARLHGARPTDRLTRAQVSDLLEGTRSTSTSTGRAATSPGTWRSTARPTGPARGAARRSGAKPS